MLTPFSSAHTHHLDLHRAVCLLCADRVNAKYLSEHRGQTVRLTAKVLKLVADTATVEASDGGEVSLGMPAFLLSPPY